MPMKNYLQLQKKLMKRVGKNKKNEYEEEEGGPKWTRMFVA